MEENVISTNNDGDNKEESKDSPESSQKDEERGASATPGPGRSSPEPNCAICLEQLQNKSFTDNCFHVFCFTCLVEWSKVKAECPLCKKSFKSIVHNVRSFNDFDQYYIEKNTTSEADRNADERPPHQNEPPNTRRIQFTRISMAIDAIRAMEDVRASAILHRLRFAPHSVRRLPVLQTATISTHRTTRVVGTDFRRRVYQENLWYVPQSLDSVRHVAPAWFRDNPAAIHRLLPWLNRELACLLNDNEGQISTVLELVMAIIVDHVIIAPSFSAFIRPHLGANTTHFVHELYQFAISPYESVESWDEHASYIRLPELPPDDPTDGDDSDVTVLPVEGRTFQESSSSGPSHTNKKVSSLSNVTVNLGAELGFSNVIVNFGSLNKVVLKRNAGTNFWNVTKASRPSTVQRTESASAPNPSEIAGPSTSSDNSYLNPSTSREPVARELEVVSSEEIKAEVVEEECEVVDVKLPISMRTPEIINIASDDDYIDVVSEDETVDKIKEIVSSNPGQNAEFVVNEYFKTVEQKISRIATNVIGSNPAQDESSDSDNPQIVYINLAPRRQESQPGTSNKICVDVTDGRDGPIDYSLKAAIKDCNVESNEPCTSSGICDNKMESKALHKADVLPDAIQAELTELPFANTGNSCEMEQSGTVKSSVLRSAARCLTNRNPCSSSASSSIVLPKKRNSDVLDEDSQKSVDSAQEADTGKSHGKLKLQSVIAHYAHDDDSSHTSSSPKKHKEKKRKRRKRKHSKKRHDDSSESE